MPGEEPTPEAMNPLNTMAAAVAFRGPVFCNKDPAMWFAILECNFKAANITKNLTKFNHAVALIPPDSLSLVSDVVSAAINSETPYEDLKEATLARLQSSAATRLKELLSKEELGNEKPSELLRRMKKLLGDKYQTFDQDIFKQLYYQRLPPNTQGSLFSVKDKLAIDELAKLADEFTATVTSPPAVHAVRSPPQAAAHSPATMPPVTATAPDTTALAAAHVAQSPTFLPQLTDALSKLTLQVDSLQKEINKMQQGLHRPRSRSRSSSASRRHSHQHYQRSPSASRDSPLCYYHHRFGDRALKCQQPCTHRAAAAQPTTTTTQSSSTAPLNPSGGH